MEKRVEKYGEQAAKTKRCAGKLPPSHIRVTSTNCDCGISSVKYEEQTAMQEKKV